MEISLTPEMERFVADEVATGPYSDPVDVVRAALVGLEKRRESSGVLDSGLDQKLAARIAEADRGEFVDTDEMWDHFDQLARERQATRA